MDRRRGWEVLGITTGAFFVTMVARLTLSPLVPDIIDSFGVSKSATGIALTGMWAAYALFQFPGGTLADRIGERGTITFAIGATGVASLILAFAPSFLWLAIFAVVLGTGAGFYYTAGSAYLTRQFENTGRALGIHEIGASAAGLIAPVAVAFLAARYGWRAGPILPAVLAFVVVGLIVRRLPRTPAVTPDRTLREQLDIERLWLLLSRPEIRFTAILAVPGYFTWQSFASFFPTFLVEYAGLATPTASIIFGGVFAVTLVGTPTLGSISDSIGRDRSLMMAFAIGSIGFIVFLVGNGWPSIVLGSLLVGGGLSFPGVINSRFMDHLSSTERGTGFGLVRTIVLLLSSLGSGVTGSLADGWGWSVAYGFTALLFAGLAGVLLLKSVRQ
jgi:MFS family permease